jgi:Uncharacterized conserved protein (DUF2088).
MEIPERRDVDHLIESQPLPPFADIVCEPETESISDPWKRASTQLDRLALNELSEGDTIAVGVGSRGIHAIDSITEAVVSSLTSRGFDPIIIPAMGSHGGATADGQREMLAALGITSEKLKVPIDAQMDVEQVSTVTVGETEMSVYMSVAAIEADAVMIINRVKAHTNFTGPIESGLTKMTVVGLGKQRGAKTFHSTAIEEGYVETLQTVFSVIESKIPLLGGIALVENFHEKIAHIEAVSADSFMQREPLLLERANDEMPTLPIDDIDLLVVDELGKDVSGAGMDTNVIGRYRVLNAPDPEIPDIKLIYARGLTEATKGNGNGIGLSDITRKTAIEQIDMQKTYANALTSGSLAKARLPVVAPDDEFALRTAFAALGGYDPGTVRVLWIQNTQDLSEMRVSESVLPDLPEAATILDHKRLTFTDGSAVFDEL